MGAVNAGMKPGCFAAIAAYRFSNAFDAEIFSDVWHKVFISEKALCIVRQGPAALKRLPHHFQM